MKVVILAGGFGTRISEESMIKPKPMINIGDVPILIHIMRFFYKNGFNEFVICGGYKCEYIKEYFWKYNIMNSDFTIDNLEGKNSIVNNNSFSEKWKVTIVDTGKDTQTAGRIKLVEKYLDGDFLMTYGDGLSDVNLNRLLEEHKKNNGLVTLTAVKTHSKFGILNIKESIVEEFAEKTALGGGWINAGFMVIKKEALDFITNSQESFEFDILPKIASSGKLFAYKHEGFWKCMDTLKDKNEFEELISKGVPPWKV